MLQSRAAIHPSNPCGIRYASLARDLVEYRAGGPDCQHAPALARLQNPNQARRGAMSVDRHINTIRFESSEHTDQGLDRLRQQQCHPISTPATGRSQRTGQPVAGLLQFAVTNAFSIADGSTGFRTALRLQREPVLKEFYGHRFALPKASRNTLPACSSSSSAAGMSRM